MNLHLHTQLHSRIALDSHICEHRVRARMHREGPYRPPGHCWAGTMDEAPAENRMNNIIQNKISTTNNVAQLQDENQCRGAMDVTHSHPNYITSYHIGFLNKQ